ncbi:MAG: class I SAM-dependent DNA methyltransferase [Fusobacteriaceae bacterium]
MDIYKNFSKVYDKFMEHCNYDEWSNFLCKIFHEYGKDNGNLLDIGCGTGEILKRFVSKYNCTGIDISEEMLKICHEKLKSKNIALYHADMVEFKIENKFHEIAISLFDTVNHLVSLDELREHFSCVKEHLAPDGIYVFDVVDRNFMNEMFKGDIFADNRENISVIWEHEIDSDGIDIINATYFIKNKHGSYDKFEEYYEKKIFTLVEIEEVCTYVGLSVEKIIENDELAGKRFFFVLKKGKGIVNEK